MHSTARHKKSPLSGQEKGPGVLNCHRLEGFDWTLTAGRLIGLVARLLWLPWLRWLVAGPLTDERQ
jgi:hypothetical protein